MGEQMLFGKKLLKPHVPKFNIKIVYKSGYVLELFNYEKFTVEGGTYSWTRGESGYPQILKLGADDISCITYTVV